MVFAYECFADADVLFFLKAHCRFALDGFHGFGQGPVVEAVLVRGTAEIGMVDEDPQASHHRERDRTQPLTASPSLEVRRRSDRYLLIVRPDLETGFLRSMRLLDLRSRLGDRPTDLRAVLNLPKHPKHRIFQQELADLHARSRERRVDTLVTELERALRDIVRG